MFLVSKRKKTYSQPEAFSHGEIFGPAALFGCNSFSCLAWRSTLKENSVTILLIVIHSMLTCWTKNNKQNAKKINLTWKVDEPVLMRYPDTALQFGFSCLSQVQHTYNSICSVIISGFLQTNRSTKKTYTSDSELVVSLAQPSYHPMK